MKLSGCIQRSILVIMILMMAALPAAAALPSAEGLQVTLLLGDVPAGETLTDATGVFALEGVAAGSYALVIADTAATMSLRFPLEVSAAQEPAMVAGEVTVDAATDIGLTIKARVVGAATTPVLAVDRAAVRPPKWNVNAAHSNGHVRVVLHGTGLAGVAMVTLTSATGSLSSTDIRLGTDLDDNGDEHASAVFGKAEAWAALVPADASRGDVIPLEIVVEGPGYSATFTQSISILGRHRSTNP